MEDIKLQVDATRLLCPMPILRAQDAIAQLSPGDSFQIRCTDPGTRQDIPSWSRVNGHEVLNIEDSENEIHFVIRIGSEEETD